MVNSRSQATRQLEPNLRSKRDEIALALDGAVPAEDRAIRAEYRAAIDAVTVAMGPHIHCLRQLGTSGQIAASARFDDMLRLLRALGVEAISTSAIPQRSSPPGILFLGCQTSDDPARTAWISRMLERGAVIVSSDRFASVCAVSSVLNGGAGHPPARARVALNPRIADGLASREEWGRLVAELNPAVRLAPGHLPLEMAQGAQTRIIASNAMTDEPLVVSADWQRTGHPFCRALVAGHHSRFNRAWSAPTRVRAGLYDAWAGASRGAVGWVRRRIGPAGMSICRAGIRVQSTPTSIAAGHGTVPSKSR